jgi:hypothetical protein
MPTKKNAPAAESAAPAAPKKRAVKKTEAASAPVAEKKAAAKKQSPAATHKAQAKRAAAKKPAVAVFDVEMHREEIAREAYHLWQNRGCVHGHQHEDWLKAIEIVRARHAG